MESFKRYGSFLLGVLIVGIGSALMVKTATGVSPYNALGQTLAFLVGMKIGTMLFIMNATLVLLQIILLRKKFKIIGFLQLLNSLLFSYVFNFILYSVFEYVEFSSYFIRIAIFIVAISILAFGVSLVMNANLVGFPPEELCKTIAIKTGGSFPKYRQYLDFIALIIVLILVFVFGAPLSIREGTIISALAFGPLLGFFMKNEKRYANE